MREIAATIDIDASPDRVWDVLADFSRYAEWNPMFTGGSGTLAARQHPGPADAHRRTHHDVQDLSSSRWTGPAAAMAGTADRARGLRGGPRVRPHSAEGGTTVVQREALVGRLVPLASSMIDKYEKTVVRLNQALRDRCQMPSPR